MKRESVRPSQYNDSEPNPTFVATNFFPENRMHARMGSTQPDDHIHVPARTPGYCTASAIVLEQMKFLKTVILSKMSSELWL